ncbi:MAG: ABC transporter ATP-binding protein [Rhodospirillales bacterium]|jgi:peptide/nickel transport system ATP-binding protein|nr:ABC transporter ATP-binding protein [Rhodospirillales bacterium]
MDDLVRVEDLRVQFQVHGGIVDAVKGASFRIRGGSSVALVGESGSGKSVISQAIMGILPNTARITGGRILFSDPKTPGQVTDIAALSPDSARMRAIRGNKISIIFQEPMTSLSPLHTIGDQIGEALHLHRDVGRREGRDAVVNILRLVGYPDPAVAPNLYPFELSGGLRQRAMIAMALICHPALLVADEPTTALDVTIQAQILKLIKDLQGELGMAVLMITHDLGVVANMAEEVVIIYQGRIMESGTAEDIFNHPSHPYLKALLKAVPHFDMKPGERLVPLREIDHQSGPMLAVKEPWPAGADDAGPMLAVEGIRKSFRTRKTNFFKASTESLVTAVDGVSFDIRRGECFGLVGESGCGKTTLSRIIMRAMTPDEGRVLLNDRGNIVDLVGMDQKALLPFREKIQMVFQDPYGSLNPRMTVFDIVREPLVIHRVGDADSQAEMVKELMRLVGLDPRFLNRYPHSFSGGQRQRIGVARALALKPDILICDEPVSALDVSIQAQLLNLLKELQSELDLTYLFISHNLAVVDYIADRIAVMCGGRLVEMAPRELLFRNPIHPYTRALFAAVPYPDLERMLDFKALSAGRSSNPAAWPKPFSADGTKPLDYIELGDGHRVLADRNADAGDLRP